MCVSHLHRHGTLNSRVPNNSISRLQESHIKAIANNVDKMPYVVHLFLTNCELSSNLSLLTPIYSKSNRFLNQVGGVNQEGVRCHPTHDFYSSSASAITRLFQHSKHILASPSSIFTSLHLGQGCSRSIFPTI